METLHYKSPLGWMQMHLNESSLNSCIFVEGDSLVNKQVTLSTLGEKVVGQLTDFFEGKIRSFELPFPAKRTPFQKEVWKTICSIPYGQTMDYTTLAHAIDRPKAVRAVGSACARNPLAIFIPCHRVIHRSGSVEGYLWGDERKKWLLEFEQAHLKA